MNDNNCTGKYRFSFIACTITNWNDRGYPTIKPGAY